MSTFPCHRDFLGGLLWMDEWMDGEAGHVWIERPVWFTCWSGPEPAIGWKIDQDHCFTEWFGICYTCYILCSIDILVELTWERSAVLPAVESTCGRGCPFLVVSCDDICFLGMSAAGEHGRRWYRQVQRRLSNCKASQRLGRKKYGMSIPETWMWWPFTLPGGRVACQSVHGQTGNHSSYIA